MGALLKSSLILLVVAVCANGFPAPIHPAPVHGHKAVDYYAEPKYKFAYGVSDSRTGDHKHATEQRDGAWTRGSYSLLQPDGIYRTVNYVSDPVGGFRAEVLNKGVAHHAHHVVKHVV